MPPASESTVNRLRGTVLDLVSLVTGADPNRLRRVPAAGGWPAATVVAHLADAELVYAVRMRMTLTEERPWLAAFREEAWVERFAPLDPDPRDSLQRWRVLRDGNVRLLASLSDEEWERTGVHEQRGPLSLAAMADDLVAHDHDHLDQLRRALAR